PKEVADYFTLDPKTVRMMLKNLCEKGWLTLVKRGIGVKNVEYNSSLLLIPSSPTSSTISFLKFT
ncbi:hypothetical protein BSO21_29225, partial [Paenibacillus odorifer]